MSDVKSQVRQFILDNFIMGSEGADFGDGASFMEHHIIDSTGFLELITFLETTFGIEVGDEEMVPENLDSLDALAAYVARKQG
ncbi:MAG: acyl carrier protein [Aquabacterium sp.]|jgi:acyl carrier protein|nr:MAG: acyl carrier protein [Aquabacterium sp.]TAL21076.1 MAG: acyl carrier protein [Aquabacterium sp.]